MKTQTKICPCCQKEKKALTHGLAVDNLDNVIICKSCALDYAKDGQIVYNENILLKTVGQRGDFKITKAYHYTPPKPKTYFERQEENRLHAMMDNQCVDNWDVMENY